MAAPQNYLAVIKVVGIGGGGVNGATTWIFYSPAARALAILLGVGVPDGVVTHFERI